MSGLVVAEAAAAADGVDGKRMGFGREDVVALVQKVVLNCIGRGLRMRVILEDMPRYSYIMTKHVSLLMTTQAVAVQLTGRNTNGCWLRLWLERSPHRNRSLPLLYQENMVTQIHPWEPCLPPEKNEHAEESGYMKQIRTS